jgi:hypothetical protein
MPRPSNFVLKKLVKSIFNFLLQGRMIRGDQTQAIFIHIIEFTPLFLILSAKSLQNSISSCQFDYQIYTELADQLERAFIETTFLHSLIILIVQISN